MEQAARGCLFVHAAYTCQLSVVPGAWSLSQARIHCLILCESEGKQHPPSMAGLALVSRPWIKEFASSVRGQAEPLFCCCKRERIKLRGSVPELLICGQSLGHTLVAKDGTAIV